MTSLLSPAITTTTIRNTKSTTSLHRNVYFRNSRCDIICFLSLIILSFVFIYYYELIQIPLSHYYSINNDASRAVIASKCSKMCDIAIIDSYSFFDNINNDEWMYKKQLMKSYYPTSWFHNQSDPEYGLNYSNPKTITDWLSRNVLPIFSCPNVLRVGKFNEHGKWTCDLHRLSGKKSSDCLIYSIGTAGGRYEFEYDIHHILSSQSSYHHKELCEIHVFDPSFVRTDPITNEMMMNTTVKDNIHYHSWGIKGMNATNVNKKYQFLTFDETIKKLQHTNRHFDIIKLDCESCEWTLYKDILSYTTDITQLLIEIHPTIYKPDHITLSQFFREIRQRHFVPFYRESHNNVNDINDVTYEFSFIKLRNIYDDVQ